MDLVVLGTSAAFQTAERASSGYLVVDRDTKILVECGGGVLSSLYRWLDPNRLDAILISHLHQDHFLDILPMFYYLWLMPDHRERPIRVIAPSGLRDIFGCILSGKSADELPDVFGLEEISAETDYEIGSLTCRFKKVYHSPVTHGIVIQGERKLAYSSDTVKGPSLEPLAEGADLFLCEATLQSPHSAEHLTAQEAGELARKAGVKKLVLTHIWPTLDREVSKEQAAAAFGGEVLIAEDNIKITV